VSVVIVVAATGCTASAKPALSPPAITPRRENLVLGVKLKS
jgi:hypothetical protein